MEPGYEALVALLADTGGAVVAYSGGVDSTLLTAAAHDALGGRALAVTATSHTYSVEELERARQLARLIGVRHEVVETHELDTPEYRANPPDRCFYCKRELFAELRRIATREGFEVVVDGTNADDLSDFRPGRAAAAEAKVRSPFVEMGLGKADVRRLARERGLPNADLPANACLASRVPYGVEITAARLERIGKAERALRSLGLALLRVRDHGEVARLEVEPGRLAETVGAGVRERVVAACKDAGYRYVCLDLEGYRTGSMNEALPKTVR
ncbi:MAG: ATP-dependent sacrificial sulfur transferase LarE [Deltaproteobacteria bacterium]|nr:ATP-dependent sacrificial sulfur transferase LarE [Deltaproteobacteria bacterium]